MEGAASWGDAHGSVPKGVLTLGQVGGEDNTGILTLWGSAGPGHA